jgi:hypothetical protein
MKATFGRILALLARGDDSAPPAFDGFLDSLLQKFENCRPGLPDAVAGTGGEAAVRFFTELYEAERPRLEELVRQSEPLLEPPAHAELFRKVDELIRNVVIPAYLRVALPYTLRERNDFYLAPEPFHWAERLAWGAAGIALGAFVVWAPFIPISAKEFIFPMMVGGLLFPNLRRFLAMRKFERELNALVSRANSEVARIDTAYLMAGVEREAGESRGEAAEARGETQDRGAAAGRAALKEGAS